MGDRLSTGSGRASWPLRLAALAVLLLISPPIRPLLVVHEIWAADPASVRAAGMTASRTLSPVIRELRPAPASSFPADGVWRRAMGTPPDPCAGYLLLPQANPVAGVDTAAAHLVRTFRAAACGATAAARSVPPVRFFDQEPVRVFGGRAPGRTRVERRGWGISDRAERDGRQFPE
jgi:hypothetical protein